MILRNLSYGDDEAMVLDLHLPEPMPEAGCDLFLYFHGGGLTSGVKEWGDVMAGYLVRKGIAVASANYRMMPKHAYPAFLEDAARATAFCTNLRKKGAYGRFNRLFLGGSSAGGYLTMMLCFDPRWLEGAGVDPSEIAGYLHDAGQPTAHYGVLSHAGIDARRVIVDDSAPLYHIRAGMTLPPMHFVVSDDDLPGRYAQTMLLVETMRIFGYGAPDITLEVRHGKHCHYDGALDEQGDSELGKMAYGLIARVPRSQ